MDLVKIADEIAQEMAVTNFMIPTLNKKYKTVAEEIKKKNGVDILSPGMIKSISAVLEELFTKKGIKANPELELLFSCHTPIGKPDAKRFVPFKKTFDLKSTFPLYIYDLLFGHSNDQMVMMEVFHGRMLHKQGDLTFDIPKVLLSISVKFTGEGFKIETHPGRVGEIIRHCLENKKDHVNYQPVQILPDI